MDEEMKAMKKLLFVAAFTALILAACCSAYGMDIAEAKQLPDASAVALTGKVVTYASANFFYIEEDLRCAGIRVEKQGHGLSVGVRTDVSGVIWTNADAERYIAKIPPDTAYAGDSVEPLLMNNKSLGGGDWRYSATTGAGQKGMSGSLSLNNIGLLVQAQGKVLSGAPGDSSFSLDDGSGGHVEVLLSQGLVSPGYGAHAMVTGVLSCAKENQQVTGPTNPTYQDFQRRVILARAVDVTQSAPTWNYTGQMIYIPVGSFLMGNSGIGDDLGYDEFFNLYYEKPQHSVYLSGYYIGKYEVTRGEYRAFMNAGGYSNPAYWSAEGWIWRGSRTEPYYWAAYQDWSFPYDDGDGFTQTDNHPVVGVTYYEADAFCNWARGHLPTEAQWEKAARWDGHPRVYPWGATWEQEKCNSWYDSLYPGYQTAPVGSYPSGASPYGCQDMAGNVWEWCEDWWREDYSQTPAGGWADPQGPSSGSSRGLRGGSWQESYTDYYSVYERCAYRYSFVPYFHHYTSVGFRLAR